MRCHARHERDVTRCRWRDVSAMSDDYYVAEMRHDARCADVYERRDDAKTCHATRAMRCLFDKMSRCWAADARWCRRRAIIRIRVTRDAPRRRATMPWWGDARWARCAYDDMRCLRNIDEATPWRRDDTLFMRDYVDAHYLRHYLCATHWATCRRWGAPHDYVYLMFRARCAWAERCLYYDEICRATCHTMRLLRHTTRASERHETLWWAMTLFIIFKDADMSHMFYCYAAPDVVMPAIAA